MAKRNFNPQRPGALPNAEPDTLQPLLALGPAELGASIVNLSNDELAGLITLEERGENRDTYLDVVRAELNTRTGGDDQPAAAPDGEAVELPAQRKLDPALLEQLTDAELAQLQHLVAAEAARRHDTKPHLHAYQHLRAHEIDASTLTRAVLSADGWVMPVAKPAAA